MTVLFFNKHIILNTACYESLNPRQQPGPQPLLRIFACYFAARFSVKERKAYFIYHANILSHQIYRHFQKVQNMSRLLFITAVLLSPLLTGCVGIFGENIDLKHGQLI